MVVVGREVLTLLATETGSRLARHFIWASAVIMSLLGKKYALQPYLSSCLEVMAPVFVPDTAYLE